MDQQRPTPSFSFHIESGEVLGGETVPASVLVQILQSAQQAFLLIGVHVEGRSIKARARVSAETSERFQLVCQLPKAGCYAMPVTVGASNDLTQAESAESALGIFHALMSRISAHTEDGLAQALPDERIRRRVLELVKGMAPRAGAKWTVSLHDSSDTPFATFDQDTIPFVQQTLVPDEQREASRVVTGELKNINFIERKLTIIYPPTNKELECIYDEALEDLLYERRRGLIQVTGRVLIGENGEPKQIIDVTDIDAVDMAPFVITKIERGPIRLAAHPPLVLEPSLDDGKQLMCVEDEKLGISTFAQTREALIIELNEQLAMLWAEFASANDSELDGPAQELKRSLLERFTEVTDAP
ncbi:hypothetical protein [Aquabacterium sp.]|uniref:hypothetical protein n=1 Tax=Aquabacterium sp. TaxID=1872578 RepID=UPI0035B117CE